MAFAFANDTIQCSGAPVQFYSYVTGLVAPPVYNWDFGDGSFANDSSPVHFYSAQGYYHVLFTVTDLIGCNAVSSLNILVNALAVNTSFTNTLCFASNTGTIQVTTIGGSPPYTYNWGGGITTQNRTLEKTVYQFTKHYFSGIQQWNIVLQAGKATERDGPFSKNNTFSNAWYYAEISANNLAIALP